MVMDMVVRYLKHSVVGDTVMAGYSAVQRAVEGSIDKTAGAVDMSAVAHPLVMV